MGSLVNPFILFPPALTDSLWKGSGILGTFASDGGSYTLGTEVRCLAAGSITAVRFLKPGTMFGVVTVALWGPGNNSNTPDRTATIDTTGLPTGWVEVPITPFAVAVDDFVLPAYKTVAATGGYYNQASYFASAGITSPGGKLSSPQTGTNPNHAGNNGNGRYVVNAALTYPNSTFGGGSYFVDAVWSP